MSIADRHLGAPLQSFEQEEFDALGANQVVRLPLSASSSLLNTAQIVKKLSKVNEKEDEVKEDTNFTKLLLQAQCSSGTTGSLHFSGRDAIHSQTSTSTSSSTTSSGTITASTATNAAYSKKCSFYLSPVSSAVDFYKKLGFEWDGSGLGNMIYTK
jgi:hypothetical protein